MAVLLVVEESRCVGEANAREHVSITSHLSTLMMLIYFLVKHPVRPSVGHLRGRSVESGEDHRGVPARLG